MTKTAVIILAAGYGKRMQSELPKALIPLHGKPLVMHVLDAVKDSGLTEHPVVVIGQKKEQVIDALGIERYYAVQREQLGTGHAVHSAKAFLAPEAIKSVIVLYADQPFVTGETIKGLEQVREKNNAKISMATVLLPDFNEWRSTFLSFSRVKRDADGKIIAVVEAKDATEEEKKILEVNPAYFCFDKAWLLESLPELQNTNAQGEYYLTDLVKLAFEQGLEIPSISINAKEAIGTNSKEDIEAAHTL